MRKYYPQIAIVASVIVLLIFYFTGQDDSYILFLAGLVLGLDIMYVLKTQDHRKYNGYLQYEVNNEGKEVWTFVVDGDPNEWHNYKDILLKVQENEK